MKSQPQATGIAAKRPKGRTARMACSLSIRRALPAGEKKQSEPRENATHSMNEAPLYEKAAQSERVLPFFRQSALRAGWDLLQALTGKAAVVDTAVQIFLGKLGIAHLGPCQQPRSQCFGLAPVHPGNSVDPIVAHLVQDALYMLVQRIFPPLLIAPSAFWLDGADETHDMKVCVMSLPSFSG